MMIATIMGTQIGSTSHPPLPDWFSLYASRLCLSHLLTLTFHDRWSVEVFLAVSKTPFDTFDVALETNRTPAREF